VAVCPGLAISLVVPEFDAAAKTSLLVLPYELETRDLVAGRLVATVDMEGTPVGQGRIVAFRTSNVDAKRKIVSVEVPAKDAYSVAGFAVLEPEAGEAGAAGAEPVTDETIICRCERITAGEIRAEIRAGVRDMNILKATIRTAMGACGGKTCTELILRLYREAGVDLSEVTLPTNRPFTAEIPLGVFAGAGNDGGEA